MEIAGGIAEEVYSVGFGVGVQPSDDTPFTVSHGGLIIGKKRHTPHFGHHVLSICGGGRYVATVVAFVAVVITVVIFDGFLRDIHLLLLYDFLGHDHRLLDLFLILRLSTNSFLFRIISTTEFYTSLVLLLLCPLLC